MDRLRKQIEDFKRALSRFEEAIVLAHENRGDRLYPFLRDSAIQRFEFTFEIFWKLVKTAMKELEGVECNSPKSCMRELFKNRYITEEELRKLFQMVDDRNLTVHTYHEKLAEELFERLESYAGLMNMVKRKIRSPLA